MRLDELIPSNSDWLAKEDVSREGRILTIRGFKRVTVKGDAGDEQKIALNFDEDVKPLLLNKVNTQRLKAATGAETTDECKGKRITVYRDDFVEFQGRTVGGLRIREAPGQSAMKTTSSVDFEDDLS